MTPLPPRSSVLPSGHGVEDLDNVALCTFPRELERSEAKGTFSGEQEALRLLAIAHYQLATL